MAKLIDYKNINGIKKGGLADLEYPESEDSLLKNILVPLLFVMGVMGMFHFVNAKVPQKIVGGPVTKKYQKVDSVKLNSQNTILFTDKQNVR